MPSKAQPNPELPLEQDATRPVINLGTEIVTANPFSQLVIDGKTLLPSGSGIEVDGTPVSLAPFASDVVIGDSTVLFISPQPSNLPRLTLDGNIFTANSISQFITDGQTLYPGGPEITVSGTAISLAPSATQVVIGGSTVKLAKSSAPTLTLQGKITNHAVGGSTVPFATALGISPALTIGGKTVFPNSASEYVIGSQTIIAGAPAITISGTRISLAPSASGIVIGGTTIPLVASATQLPPLTINGITILPNTASQYLIDSQTLIPGAPAITISGTRISLAPSASGLVIGSKTLPLTSGPVLATLLPLLSIGNSVITPNAASQYIIAGQTLVPGGPAITVSGTRISLTPKATDVILGASTERLAGVGVTVTGSAMPTGPPAFLGAASRVHAGSWIFGVLVLMVEPLGQFLNFP